VPGCAPAVSVVGRDGDALAVLLHQNSEQATVRCLEADAVANVEGHRLDIGLHGFEHLHAGDQAHIEFQ